MKTQFDNLQTLFARFSKTLPVEIQSPQELEPLTNVLPHCPYRIVGAIGNEVARNPYTESLSSHPKRLDLDLIVPFVQSPPDLWQELIQVTKGSSEVVLWDEGNIMVLLDNGTFSILNPAKYGQLSLEECQLEVSRVFCSQIDPQNASLHKVDTGEATIFVGENIANFPNPKDDKYPGVYADVYPLILEVGQPEDKALIARGYLPQSGNVVVLPNGDFFDLPVNLRNHPLPDLDTSYLSRSPYHAVQFLRRLTKSTINLFAHRRFFDELPEQLKYFSEIYDKVNLDFVEPHLNNPDLKKSLESLQRKIKKIDKMIARENKRRSQFNLLQPLELNLSQPQHTQSN